MSRVALRAGARANGAQSKGLGSAECAVASGRRLPLLRAWAHPTRRAAPSLPQGPPMPEMLQLHAWLEAHIPAGDADPAATRISHGDFR